LMRHVSQIEGNTEFVAIYPSHEALHNAEKMVSMFNNTVAPAVMWGYEGYEGGMPTKGMLYIYARVNLDQQTALGHMLELGCNGPVACVRSD
jgi:hypothetical protein